jgi:hypothetical protein
MQAALLAAVNSGNRKTWQILEAVPIGDGMQIGEKNFPSRYVPAPIGTASYNNRNRRISNRYGGFSWSRVRESNPPPRLGKPMYYRCTNPAFLTLELL